MDGRPEPGLPLLETDVIRTFVAIAETGSFSRAARSVLRTPSAVSMQVKRLEETLGQTLFVRDSRHVRLTPEGEALLGYGRRLLKLNREAVSQFLRPSLAGTVRFGTPDDIGTRILPSLLCRFAGSHPAVQVDVVVGRSTDMIRRLDEGDLDLILVTAGNEGQDSDRGEVVHTEPLVWAGREGGVAAEREPLPLALAEHGCAWRKMALDGLDRVGRHYRVAFTSEHCAGQAAAMMSDLAVAPFPRSLVRPPLRVIGEEAGLPGLGEYQILILRGADRGEAAEALAGHVADCFRELGRAAH